MLSAAAYAAMRGTPGNNLIGLTLADRETKGFAPYIDTQPVQSQVPVPAALPLFAGGLGVLSLLARRRNRKKKVKQQ